MGLMNFIFKGLGFEGRKEKPKDKQKTSSLIKNEKGNFLNNEITFSEIKSVPQSNNINMTNLSGAPSGINSGAKNMLIYVPKNNKDIQIIVDALRRHESAIVNLGFLNGADTQKIIDFLSGAVYALRGNIRKLENNLFLLTPEEVNVVAPPDNK